MDEKEKNKKTLIAVLVSLGLFIGSILFIGLILVMAFYPIYKYHVRDTGPTTTTTTQSTTKTTTTNKACDGLTDCNCNLSSYPEHCICKYIDDYGNKADILCLKKQININAEKQ